MKGLHTQDLCLPDLIFRCLQLAQGPHTQQSEPSTTCPALDIPTHVFAITLMKEALGRWNVLRVLIMVVVPRVYKSHPAVYLQWINFTV